MRAASTQASDRKPGCAPPLRPRAACSLLVLACLLTGTAPAYGSDAPAGGESGAGDIPKRAGSATAETAPDTASAAEDRAIREPEKTRLTPKGALWRSALVPGWGQFRNGRHIKAVLFSAAAAGFAGASISETRNLNRIEDSERQAVAGRRNTRLLLFVATATFSALDAYVDAHLADFGVSLAGGTDFPADLSLTWRFK